MPNFKEKLNAWPIDEGFLADVRKYILQLESALEDCQDYFDDRADVVEVDEDGHNIYNEEMHLWDLCQRTLKGGK